MSASPLPLRGGKGLILTVLALIQKKLAEYFKNADATAEDWVILGNIVDHDGRLYAAAKDKIVMMLVNIKHETVISTYTATAKSKTSAYAVVPAPLYIDLYLLFLANFYDDNYPVGLEMISRTISFFQQNPWFTSANMPGLPPSIDKLTMEITNLDLLEVNYLMGMIGTKYLPSAYYKLRMLPFTGDAIQGVVPAVEGGDNAASAPA
jgi:Pvc16 N-terminal domain